MVRKKFNITYADGRRTSEIREFPDSAAVLAYIQEIRKQVAERKIDSYSASDAPKAGLKII